MLPGFGLPPLPGRLVVVRREVTAITAQPAVSLERSTSGWGLRGHAHTNAELVGAARAQIAELAKPPEP